jgi:hypothetical protein
MNNCESCKLKHEGIYGSGRFCSSKCARGFSTQAKRKEINEKVSIAAKERAIPNVIKICPYCKTSFAVSWSRRHKIFCNRKCSATFIANTEDGRMQRIIAGRKSAQSICKRSKNEILMFNLCNEYFIEVLNNEPMFNGWDADIILIKEKIAILWNGKWHYEKITKKHSVDQVQHRDRIKIKEIEKMGYSPYIIKDMGSYDFNFVKNQFEILKTKLITAGTTKTLTKN